VGQCLALLLHIFISQAADYVMTGVSNGFSSVLPSKFHGSTSNQATATSSHITFLFNTILVSATHITKLLINLSHISAELFLSFFMLAHEGCGVQFHILATLSEVPVPSVQKYGLDMKQFWETQSAP
jgi:hypothetical protein